MILSEINPSSHSKCIPYVRILMLLVILMSSECPAVSVIIISTRGKLKGLLMDTYCDLTYRNN